MNFLGLHLHLETLWNLYRTVRNSIFCPYRVSYIGLLGIRIIMIFYCGLMVHITDTRAQKEVRYISAHITETV